MKTHLQDFWESCYSPEFQKLGPPEEFREFACANCNNTLCRNSKGSDTLWAKRIQSQEELLLRKPIFGDPTEARFRGIAEMDFPNLIREVLAIEIADRKNDWSITTPEEIGQEAASLFGLAPPIHWVAEPEPEEEPEPAEEEPEPAEKLVDEVSVTDLQGNPTKLNLETPKIELPKPALPNIESPKPAPPNIESPKIESSWKILGDSGKKWDVKLYVDGSWGCGCPAFLHKGGDCKHIQDVQRKLKRSPIQEEVKKPEPLHMPPPGVAPIFKPPEGNTKIPSGGLMLGGGSPNPAPATLDPWGLPPTAPPLNERVIPVGGKIQFKRR